MEGHSPADNNSLPGNFEDFFDTGLCGFILAGKDGFITRANAILAGWMNCEASELKGKRFSDLLSIGGKIYYETHLSPMLSMQGFFDEVVIELNNHSGKKMRVLLNAFESKDENGALSSIRYTILKASDRLIYEQNLQVAKASAEKELLKQTEIVDLREQLIAVLGHDLRNPLSAVVMAVDLLISSPGEDNADLLLTLKRSSTRMSELVNNIMDFARTRLGQRIVLSSRQVYLEPVLQQVLNEIKLIYPDRKIATCFEITGRVLCDPDRIAQLFSNLLANAFTHGDDDFAVLVKALTDKDGFELSVSNKGAPIPDGLQQQLFAPFTRENTRSSQQGLGLGLYISAEIAKAHNGELSFISDSEETRFIFTLPIPAGS